jgi:hypothetical protein
LPFKPSAGERALPGSSKFRSLADAGQIRDPSLSLDPPASRRHRGSAPTRLRRGFRSPTSHRHPWNARWRTGCPCGDDAKSGIGGLARVGFGAMSNRAERSRTGPNVAPGGLSLRLDLVEHQVEFTPCSAAALRPEARAAARQSRDVSVSWSRPILEDWIRLDAGAPKKMMSPARAIGSLWIPRTRSRFTFLAACSGPPTVVRIPEGAERLRVSRDLNRGEIF